MVRTGKTRSSHNERAKQSRASQVKKVRCLGQAAPDSDT